MNITFLGTGTSQGVPVVACQCTVCKSTDPRDNRLRSSVLIEESGKTIVIDAGPDFRQQLLRENITKLDGIVLTHGHKDHIGGLDDVRAFNYLQKKAVDIFARREVHQQITKEFDYAFCEERYPGVPEFRLQEISNHPFEVEGIRIIPIEAMHFKLPVFGYRIGSFAYLTDLSFISDEEKEKLSGAKIVVLAALRKKPHYSHMNLSQALELIQEIKPETAYLTHISHLMGLHREVEKELPENVYIAHDGLKIECPC